MKEKEIKELMELVDFNETLHDLHDDFGYTIRRLAEICEVSCSTIEAWIREEGETITDSPEACENLDMHMRCGEYLDRTSGSGWFRIIWKRLLSSGFTFSIETSSFPVVQQALIVYVVDRLNKLANVGNYGDYEEQRNVYIDGLTDKNQYRLHDAIRFVAAAYCNRLLLDFPNEYNKDIPDITPEIILILTPDGRHKIIDVVQYLHCFDRIDDGSADCDTILGSVIHRSINSFLAFEKIRQDIIEKDEMLSREEVLSLLKSAQNHILEQFTQLKDEIYTPIEIGETYDCQCVNEDCDYKATSLYTGLTIKNDLSESSFIVRVPGKSSNLDTYFAVEDIAPPLQMDSKLYRLLAAIDIQEFTPTHRISLEFTGGINSFKIKELVPIGNTDNKKAQKLEPARKQC